MKTHFVVLIVLVVSILISACGGAPQEVVQAVRQTSQRAYPTPMEEIEANCDASEAIVGLLESKDGSVQRYINHGYREVSVRITSEHYWTPCPGKPHELHVVWYDNTGARLEFTTKDRESILEEDQRTVEPGLYSEFEIKPVR